MLGQTRVDLTLVDFPEEVDKINGELGIIPLDGAATLIHCKRVHH